MNLSDIFSAQELIKPVKKECVMLSHERVKEINEVDLNGKFTYFLMQHPQFVNEYPVLRLTEADTNNGEKELPSACSRGGKPKLWALALSCMELNNWEVKWGDILDQLESFTQKSITEQSAKNHINKACRTLYTVFNMDVYFDKTTDQTRLRSVEERDIQLHKHLLQAEKVRKLIFKDYSIQKSSNRLISPQTESRVLAVLGLSPNNQSNNLLMPETEWSQQVA